MEGEVLREKIGERLDEKFWKKKFNIFQIKFFWSNFFANFLFHNFFLQFSATCHIVNIYVTVFSMAPPLGFSLAQCTQPFFSIPSAWVDGWMQVLMEKNWRRPAWTWSPLNRDIPFQPLPAKRMARQSRPKEEWADGHGLHSHGREWLPFERINLMGGGSRVKWILGPRILAWISLIEGERRRISDYHSIISGEQILKMAWLGEGVSQIGSKLIVWCTVH